ncbi:hypothetical protein BR93DRAFT_978564 [Coniochaeta sp. PMI_546]|nr:hypothetical protein BR93DRAFT_978564 [Coniochaeta sp. PMI_546]
MPVKHFDLGELQTTSKNSKQSLLLACSITLDIPATIDEHISPTELAEMTETGRLWIAKATTCRLEVASSVQGGELHGPDESSTLAQYVVGAVEGCTIWEDLGLKLRKEPSKAVDDVQQETYTRFLVNHPDLLSDFLSPKDIPCAKLLKVTCSVCYGSRPRKKCIKKPNKRRKIEEPERTRVQAPYGLRHKPQPSKQASERDADEEEEENDDADEDERNKTQKRRHISHNPRAGPGTQNAIQPQRNERREPGGEELDADVALMIKAALTKLLGIKKTTRGVRVVTDLPGPSLIDIAPAVFNIRYLQAFSSRAEHIHWIASCLSGLNAESPTLRAKIRSLVEGDPNKNATAELQKRLHMLVQRGLDVPPIAPSKRGTKARASVTVDRLSQQPVDHSPQTQGVLQQPDNHPHQPEPALEQEPVGFWHHDDIESGSQDAMINDSQQALEFPEDEPPNSWHYSQQPGHEWLDLSQASFILDENGQAIAFEDLEPEEHSYQLVPLEDD